jgi:hypothetical protein
MRYRVSFAKRFQSDGNESVLNPTAELDVDIPDGVVADKVFVGRFDPESKHSQEVLDEDDAFLGSAAAELWEYDVVDGQEQEFIDAMTNSETVMEFAVIDETSTDPEDAIGTDLDDAGNRQPDRSGLTDEVPRRRSGTRSIDDGAGGQPTADASAGDLQPGRATYSGDDAEGISDEGGGGIDDLTVLQANDKRLGLTDIGKKGPDDWAADTGPTAVPGSGIRSK